MTEIERRLLLQGGLAAAAGAGALFLSENIPRTLGPHRLPIDGGPAASADLPRWLRHGNVGTTWFAHTDQPVVALTFDDGPAPNWTPMVLDTLDEHQAPATFFMVGAHLRKHRALVEGRLDMHDVGNHTWNHADLAQLGPAAVRREIVATHHQITEVTGAEPYLLRPPWGHLAGSTLLTASDLGYHVVLWSMAMSSFDRDNPVDGILAEVTPGSILLAHDVGDRDRLPGLRKLGDLITGLRARGYRLVTVTELLNSVQSVPS
jgi:peptidoglycan/xylan/chitin deacetylase (PgdA/CDA1 family)